MTPAVQIYFLPNNFMPRNLVGEVFFNQFRVENFVASGGMATIYRVWDMTRGVPLAMKVLNPELAEDPAFIARFQREASSLQQLIHPHIVPFYGLYRDNGLTFILERYIDGPSLDEILRSRAGKPLPLMETMVFFKSLFTSLGYAHAQGIIHCDVKPGNVLVDQGGLVYLTDFGIARYMDSSATTSVAMGTPLYMAPEQVRGQNTTPQTDIYSLGVVLFELLTGRRPFKGEGDLPAEAGENVVDRVRYQQLYIPSPDPRDFNPDLPPALCLVVRRAMSKDPRDRYPSVQSMADEVAQAVGLRFETLRDRIHLDGQPDQEQYPLTQKSSVLLPPPSAGNSSSRPETYYPSIPEPHANRRRWVILAAGVALLMLCVLAAGALTRAFGNGTPIFGGLVTQNPSLPQIPWTLSPTGGVSTQLPSQDPGATQTTSEPILPPSPEPATPVGIGQVDVNGQIVIVLRERGKERLYMFDAGSGQMSELPDVTNINSETALAPAWSPDGERLAWMAQYKGKMHIIAMEFAEGEPYQIPSGEGYDQVSSPAWLPGSQQLSFLAVDSAGNWFLTADAKTGEMVDMVELPGYRNLFAWNPAGGLIAYARRSSSILDVVISSSPTTEDISLQTGGEEYAPAWSTNGETIAFQSDAGRSSGMNEIWIGMPDGSGLRQVTNTPEGSWSRAPTWSPDGRWIAFVSDQAGSRGRDYGELFAVELGTGRVVQLTNTGGNVYDWRPAWRP